MTRRQDIMEVIYDRLKQAGYVGLVTVNDGNGSRSRWIGKPGEGEDLDISVNVETMEKRK